MAEKWAGLKKLLSKKGLRKATGQEEPYKRPEEDARAKEYRERLEKSKTKGGLYEYKKKK